MSKLQIEAIIKLKVRSMQMKKEEKERKEAIAQVMSASRTEKILYRSAES